MGDDSVGKKELQPHERIILPLDMGDGEAAVAMAKRFGKRVGMMKIGLRLILSRRGGWDTVDEIRDEVGDDRIMYDCKLHDIKATMEGALEEILAPRPGDSQGFCPNFLTVHADPGSGHVKVCVDIASGRAGILGVTVLTSVSEQMWTDDHRLGTLQGEIYRRAVAAAKARARGTVCSAEELNFMRPKMGPSAIFVTPGIRLARDAKGDQQRVVTPAQAFAAGADYLVIGRSITNPTEGTSDQAIDLICEEIAGATRTVYAPHYQLEGTTDGGEHF